MEAFRPRSSPQARPAGIILCNIQPRESPWPERDGQWRWLPSDRTPQRSEWRQVGRTEFGGLQPLAQLRQRTMLARTLLTVWTIAAATRERVPAFSAHFIKRKLPQPRFPVKWRSLTLMIRDFGVHDSLETRNLGMNNCQICRDCYPAQRNLTFDPQQSRRGQRQGFRDWSLDQRLCASRASIC